MIVSTATGEYLGPSPQTLSIAKRAMEAALPHLKEMRRMQAHFRAIQPYLNFISRAHSQIQYLNSILPALNFLRFIEEIEALSRAQRQIRFYWGILSKANYRKEEIFCSQVENSPPTTLDSHVTSSEVAELTSLETLKSKSNGSISRYFSREKESRVSVIPEVVRKYFDYYKILRKEGLSKKKSILKLIAKWFLEKLFKNIC